MSGRVEADETFIGAKARNMHKGKRKVKGTGTVAMNPVMGLLACNDSFLELAEKWRSETGMLSLV